MNRELYILDSDTYERTGPVIDKYQSVVWTERFIEPGEVKLGVAATEENYERFPAGTLLGHAESRQPMLVDTREIQGGALAISGKTLLAFFSERHIDKFKITDAPVNILNEIITRMQDQAAIEEDVDTPLAIPSLQIGTSAPEGAEVTEEFEGGPAGDALLKIAKKYRIGMGVYRVWDDAENQYKLNFSTYAGQDLYSVVRFAPALGNFSDPKDLVSEVDYKTVAITRPPVRIKSSGTILYPTPIKVYNEEGDEDLPVFQQRVLDVDCTDISEDDVGSSGTEADKIGRIENLMTEKARQALNDHKRTDVVDGEVASESPFKYYEAGDTTGSTTYRMGDVVSAVGNLGQIRRKIVTEYIRSVDNSGIRAYPTLAENEEPAFEEGITLNKTVRTIVVGPAGSPIAEGTMVPPYYSHRGRIIGFRHEFTGGGQATISVFAGPDLDLLAEVEVTVDPDVFLLDEPYDIYTGEPVQIEVTTVAEECSGLSFGVMYYGPSVKRRRRQPIVSGPLMRRVEDGSVVPNQ